MKICVISRGDIEIVPPTQGASVKLFSTIKFLSLLGHEVYFVTSEQSFYIHVKDGNFEKRIYPDKIRNFFPYGNIRKKILINLGIPKEDVVLYKPLLDFNLWVKSMYVARKEKIDIVQAEFPAFSIPALFSKLMARVPSVLVEHNVEYFRIRETSKPSKLGNFILKLIEKVACKISDSVVSITSDDKVRLEKLGIDDEKIHIIPHGVNLNDFINVDQKYIKSFYELNGTVLFFHGVLVYPPNKEAARIITNKIMPSLKKMENKYSAMIVGDYPPKELKHEDVVFTGVVKDLPKYIDACDIAIVPLTAGGGMRMKILEYFAAKKPVISTPKGAEGFDVTDGKELILAEIDEFPDKIEELNNSKKLQKKLINNAYEFVKDYDWKNICKMYVRVYTDLLSDD